MSENLEHQEVLVPRTRAYVPIRELDFKYIIGKSKYTYEEVIRYVQNVMNETLLVTVEECRQWIYKYVPKRSGDLQETLIKFLEKSIPPPSLFNEIRNVRLTLGAGVEVPYAKYVRDMTAKQVQHFGTWFEHSGRKAYSKGKPVFLNDPNAVNKYFDKLTAYGIERLKINLSKIKWVTMNG